jgi:hypothetical protein
MNRLAAGGISGFGNADFDSYVARFVGARKLVPFLGGIALVPELLRTAGPRPGMIAVIVVLVALGMHAVWRYQRHPTSVRAFFWMLDGLALSFSGLLLLLFLLAAATWARNFFLYTRYWYAYLAAGALIFIWLVLLRGGDYQRVPKQQAEMLRAAAPSGRLSARQFYDILTLTRGAKEVLKNWTAARYQAIFGPMAVASVVIIRTTGGDWTLYVLFLVAVVGVVPFILATSLRRRLLVHRGLGSGDIELLPD